MEQTSALDLDRQFCTFRLDEHYFAVDVQSVQEVFQLQGITPVPRADETISGLINLRGQIITAIDLRRRLGLPPREEGVRPTCIVIRTEDDSVCLLVDKIGDVLSPPADSFEEAPENIDGSVRDAIRGVHKLENEILLILKTEVVVEMATA